MYLLWQCTSMRQQLQHHHPSQHPQKSPTALHLTPLASGDKDLVVTDGRQQPCFAVSSSQPLVVGNQQRPNSCCWFLLGCYMKQSSTVQKTQPCNQHISLICGFVAWHARIRAAHTHAYTHTHLPNSMSNCLRKHALAHVRNRTMHCAIQCAEPSTFCAVLLPPTPCRSPSALWWAARYTHRKSRRPKSSWRTSGARLVSHHGLVR